MKYRNILLCLIPLLLASCATPEESLPSGRSEQVQDTRAEQVVRAYMLSESVKEQSVFVLDPKTAIPRMEERYVSKNPSKKIKAISRTDGEEDPKPGKYGTYKAEYVDHRGREGSSIFYVKNTGDTLKIDWENSHGWNDIPWDTYWTIRPTQPIMFRIRAQLTNRYDYGFEDAEKTHHSIFLQILYGYVEKKSALGKRLSDILKDGKLHNVTLKLRYLPNAPSGSSVIIDDLVTEGWLVEDWVVR